ncbi:MAG: FtsQ-type POTRA domain-containing protein [Buchananella hordeovulneris]|nr:FtsQ-type POTRA domain-containing protein [Buchananella hordeovulneris]
MTDEQHGDLTPGQGQPPRGQEFSGEELERLESHRSQATFGRRLNKAGDWEEPDQDRPADLSSRITERESAKKSARIRKIALWGSPVLVVAFVAGFGLWSPYYRLNMESVSVTGGDAPTQARVLAKVEERAGTPLLLLNTGELDRVIEEIDAVDQAEVTRRPPKGVEVQIKMHAPAIAVPLEGGDFELFALNGASLGKGANEASLPRVELEAGGERSMQARAGAAALSALPEGVRTQLSGCRVSVAGQATFTLTSGATVLWGDESEPQLKAQVLALLLEQPAKQYDVSNPDRPSTLGG